MITAVIWDLSHSHFFLSSGKLRYDLSNSPGVSPEMRRKIMLCFPVGSTNECSPDIRKAKED